MTQVSDLGYHWTDRDLPNMSEVGADNNVVELRDFEFQVTEALDIDRVADLTLSLQCPNSHCSDPTQEDPSLQESAQSPEPPSNALLNPAEKSLLASSAFENVKKKRFFAKRFSGWRGGIVLNATLAGAVLLINVIILIWVGVKFKFDNGIATVFSGSCPNARYLKLVAHLFINILSTLLLGASNYATQIAASPSRAEVDRAHRQQQWVDIGVFSIRNFKWVSRYRLAIYGLLVLSSIPLHFLYNSVLASSLTTPLELPILYVTPQYFNLTAGYTPPDRTYNSVPIEYPTYLAKVRERATKRLLKHIGVEKCANLITSASVQSEYEGIIYVETSVSYNNSTTVIDIDYIFFNSYYPNFVPKYSPTDCWADALEADCHLYFNSSLMVAVIVANIVKCVVMILMVHRITTPTLVTRGDAIASFLSVEDPATLGLCNITKHRLRRSEWIFRDQRPYVSTAKHWGSSASRLKWGFSMLTCGAFVLTAAGMLDLALVGIGGLQQIMFGPSDPPSIGSIGFDAPSFTTTLSNGLPQGANPFQLVLLVNTPQLLLSTGYLLINNLLTDMLGAWEWNKIGVTKTRLRTTVPEGQQRSTYFLQLPYVYAIPLLIIMTAMHYLVSSSFFVVDIMTYGLNPNGNFTFNDPLSSNYDNIEGWIVNYSPLAIILVLTVSVLLIAFPIALSFLKLKPGILMVGSNSALISAACHPPRPGEDEDAGLLPVQWGCVVGSAVEGEREKGIFGRCSISAKEVEMPVEGRLYSGLI